METEHSVVKEKWLNMKVPRPERWAEYLLKELHANYRRTGQPSTKWLDLLNSFLSKVGGRRITREQVPGCPGEQINILQPALKKYGLEACEEALRITEQRGWVTLEQSAPYFSMTATVTLTPDGMDHARRLLRPWYIKMCDFMKGDVRAILVAAVTTVVTLILTAIVMRALGWG